MTSLRELLDGSKQTDSTISTIAEIPYTGAESDYIKRFMAVRKPSSGNTCQVEYFQVYVENFGNSEEEAYFVGKCPCDSQNGPDKTQFEKDLDAKIKKIYEKDARVEKVTIDFIDPINDRAQITIIRQRTEGMITRSVVNMYRSDKSGKMITDNPSEAIE